MKLINMSMEHLINHPPPFKSFFFLILLYKNIFLVSTIMLILVSIDLEIFYSEEKELLDGKGSKS
ncbi:MULTISPECIES: hypothetical protein [Bacillus]|nr:MULTISPECIES: hypothetical protein [Bacillus]MDR0124800.1 hypothetical protein [Bacillus zhangzhouensis]PRO41269.1 hypothetical protein C6W18_13175 [Bacillus sp. LLTC93]